MFCLAQACDRAPEAEDVVPVILRPGFVFVIHRGCGIRLLMELAGQ